MDYLKQITDAIELSNKAQEKFQADIYSRLETIDAKSRRPHFGGDPNGGEGVYDAKALSGERKDFDGFLRRGETKSMSTGSGPDGGFAVPKVIDGVLETLLVKQSPIRQLASVVQTSTQDYHKLVNVRGEAATWAGETAARPETTAPQLADIEFPFGELYANPQATQAMLDDAFFNAEQWLAETLADQFAAAEGAAFVSGTGVNQPMGFLSGTINNQVDGTRAFGAVQYIASGASGAFIASSSTTGPTDCLIQTIQAMKPGYRSPGDCAWVMSPVTLSVLMQLKDLYGRPLVMQSNVEGIRPLLLGYQVYEAQHVPDCTTAGSYAIAFANWRRAYQIVDRIGTRIVRDPFSNKPYVGFYTTKRVSGSVVNSEALKLVKFAAS